MPKGGARVRSGPPPDPDALRRDRDSDGDWLVLPVAGRQGDTPAWPLPTATERELKLWADEWRRPQALVWDRNGQHLEVALFVRAVVEAEDPRATTASRTLVRQQMDSLGISIPGMRANRWRIEEPPPKPAPRQRSASRQSSARDRISKVVEGGGS